MRNKQYYLNKYVGLSSDELKDIIVGRFRSYSDKEVASAIELISTRSSSTLPKGKPLEEAAINNLSTEELLQMVQNELLYGLEKVHIARAEILKRETFSTASLTPQKTTLVQLIIGLGVMIGVVLVLKLIALLTLFIFLLQSLKSCLS